MKKGFTLIELLAVIVIVAIITLIATPIISNIVNNSKVGALKNSAYGLLEASNLYYAQNGSKGIRFDINDNIVTSNDTTKLLNYKGSIKRGTVIIDKKGNTTICITDGTNSAYKNYNDNDITTVTKETCNIPENKSIVYLENSGATRSELNNQELTDLVSTLQDEIGNLKTKNQALENTVNELENNKASKSELEIIGTVANSATLDKVYPVGSIYLSVDDVNPSTLFGGTWEKIEDRFLLSSGTNTLGSTGGYSSVSYTPAGTVGAHTLTINEMPNHNHSFGIVNWNSDGTNAGPLASIPSVYSVGGGTSYSNPGRGTTGNSNYNTKGNTMIWPAGGSQGHAHTFTGTASNITTMPPYLVVNVWKRTQ